MRKPRRTFEDAHREKLAAMKEAEDAGVVADSMAVRMALVQRFDAGEITLDQMQAELKRIKREGKKAGLTTRSEVYRDA